MQNTYLARSALSNLELQNIILKHSIIFMRRHDMEWKRCGSDPFSYGLFSEKNPARAPARKMMRLLGALQHCNTEGAEATEL
jgi:hypothetical protein